MEELLVLIVQVIVEGFLELLIYGGLDLAAFSIRSNEKEGSYGCVMMVVFLVLGAALGGLANMIHPRSFLPYPWLRITNLIAGPILVGIASWLFAEWRRQRR